MRRLGWLAVLGLAYAGLLWAQPEPPFRDFTARAEVRIQRHAPRHRGAAALHALAHLAALWHAVPGPHSGNSYAWSDVGIAARMADGSAVVVTLHPPCHAPSRIEPYAYPDGAYPVVYWLDKADRPERVEAYFDRSGYESAGARVKLKRVEMAFAGPSAMPRLRATSTERAVP